MAQVVAEILQGLLDATSEPLPYGIGILAWVGAYTLFDDQRVRVLAAMLGFLVGLVLTALLDGSYAVLLLTPL